MCSSRGLRLQASRAGQQQRLRLMGTMWQLEAGSQSSAHFSALANATATAVRPARDELAEIGDHGDREGSALCSLDKEKSDGYREDPEQVLHFEGPFGLNEAGSSGLVCGLMARPPEAIGATSAQLLEKCGLGEQLLANFGEHLVVDQREVEFNGFDDCFFGSVEPLRTCRTSGAEVAVSVAWRSRVPTKRSILHTSPYGNLLVPVRIACLCFEDQLSLRFKAA